MNKNIIIVGLVALILGTGIGYMINSVKHGSHDKSSNPFADLSTMSYSSRDTAGQTADLLNNQIGRQIAIDNPQATSNEIAGLSVQYFHTNGLYVVHPGENGMYNVTQTTTSIETYTNDLNTVSQLGKKGLKK